MTKPDTAAIAAAKADAEAAMARLAKAEQDAEASRAQRDAAIQKMKDAGRSIADIHRDLNIPVSTVRQSLRMAVIRAANR